MSKLRERLESLSPEQRALLALKVRNQIGDKAAGAAAALPSLVPDPERWHDPFPSTDLQQAYLLGRTDTFPLGRLASRAYFELECADLDVARLSAAWNTLVARHDMLRLVVEADGSQQVLAAVPSYRIAERDLRHEPIEAVAVQLDRIQREMRTGLRPAAEWPLFELRLTRVPGGAILLHLCFDLLNVDGGSIAILFRELDALYHHPESSLPALEVTFRDVTLEVARLEESEEYRAAQRYWLDRLTDLPPAPELPLASAPGSIRSPQFVRRSAELSTADSDLLQQEAAKLGVTPTALFIAAYADVLSSWSQSPRFSLNVPLSNRLPIHPQVNDLVGPFTSVELLAVDCGAVGSFAELSRQVQAQLLDDLAHRRFDGVRLQRELFRVRGPEGAAMPVVFTSLLDHGFTDAAERVGTVVRSINQTAQVWMDLHVDKRRGAFVFKWDAVEGLFPEGMIGDMLAAFRRVLDGVARGRAGERHAGAQHVPPSQLARRVRINRTAAPVPAGLAHQMIEQQASARPGHPAVVANDRVLTFGELDRLANRVGRRLRDAGVSTDSLVAIVMEKGWEQIVAVLGVLKAGGAYLPVDPEVPASRLRFLLEHGRTSWALTQARLDLALDWPSGVARLAVDREEDWADAGDSPLPPVQEPHHLAYVLYTSGSTGVPNGVMIEHRSVVNRMTDVIRRFAIGPHDRLIALTALNHDLSVFDIFGGLGAGATLVLPRPDRRREPEHWAALIGHHGITTWNSVPAFLEMLVEYLEHRPPAAGPGLAPLRRVMLSGDWVPTNLPDRIRHLAPDAQVISLGGPTETTVWDICYPVERVEPGWTSVPYGQPMVNAAYHVLNGQLEERPDWVTGELYIGGTGLARGYWRDENRTRLTFIEHPVTGERLYKSGDLGRWLPGDVVEFVGRADFQVKIQGQRIELHEIEVALEQHDRVRAAAVNVWKPPKGGNVLVAYVVPTDGQLQHAQLERFVSERLPAHMVPARWVTLDALPLSRNGKLDRQALPDPATAAGGLRRGSGEPAGALVRQIAALVEDLLGVSIVDPAVSLLSYGASSIDLVRLGNRLEDAFGTRPRIDELFRLQTVDALARYYTERGAEPEKADGNASAVSADDAAGLVASYTMLHDPAEREAFKDAQPGIRRNDVGCLSVQLGRPGILEERDRLYTSRRSHRNFSLKPVAVETFSRFLSCLASHSVAGKPKYRYASAGSLYPNQLYVHAKAGRVDGVPAGVSYYHPMEHRLVVLTPDAALSRDIHIPFINTPVFDEAAFSVFIVAQIGAIAPMYGDRSLHFVTLEAGIMAHLLEESAAACGLGLCHIGTIAFDRVRHLFRLDPSHVLIHSLVGGLPAGASTAPQDDGEVARQLLAKVQELSPEEVRRLLQARRAARRGPGDS